MGNKLKAAGAAAIALLIGLEGYGSKPYLDVAGIWTDCYGNTKDVRPDHIRPKAECEALLGTEVDRIGRMVLKDAPAIPKNTLVAVISWVYNVGDGAYRSSTGRRLLLQQDWLGMCNQLHRWVYITVNGAKVKSKGLQNRRDAEYRVCIDI